MGAVASKRFSDEFSSALDKVVRVTTSQGERFTGKLVAYNPNDYSIWLLDATNDQGYTFSKLFVAGPSISTLEVLEEISGPDMEQLYERITRVIDPKFVNFHKEANVIVVMDRIRVKKDGVDGSGPLAERIQKVYEEFMREQSQKKGT